MSGERHTIALEERLWKSKDRQVNVRWPIALDKRLDDLVQRAVDAGEKTNRRELLAALLLDSALTGDELGGLLKAYRTATVGEALLNPAKDAHDNVVELTSHRPGPRVADV